MKSTILRCTALVAVAVLGFVGVLQLRRHMASDGAPTTDAPALASLSAAPPETADASAEPAPVAWQPMDVPADQRYAGTEQSAPQMRGQQPDETSEAPRQLTAAADEEAQALNPFNRESGGDAYAARQVAQQQTAAAADDIPNQGAEPAANNFAPPADDRYADNAAAAAAAPRSIEPVRQQLAADAQPMPTEASQRLMPVPQQPAAAGSGAPGNKELDGRQAPQLAIEKVAPDNVQVGKPATFVTKIRNVGNVAAHSVTMTDQTPKGADLVKTNPQSAQSPTGELVWELGTLAVGEEKTVEMQVMPTSEGEIGSVASVSFRAEASVRTRVTKPELALTVDAASTVLMGESLTLKVRINNPGSGTATGVILTETVPSGMKHPGGTELEFEVGVLQPGESRNLELTVSAVAAGAVTNILTAVGDANLRAEARSAIEITAPGLKVAMTGPKRRYLERSATYNISVSNPGTAPAKEIELVSVLPKGLKFVEANNAGQYDKTTHSVYWSLEELPAQGSGSVSLTALPVEPGEMKLQIKGQAQRGLSDQREESITVEGLSAILFELVDVNDPIEVGGDTTYEVRVVNQGSKEATNVQLVAILPAEMKFISAEGPVKHSSDGQRVLFEPLKQLAPKADTTYSIKVQGTAPGDLRLKVQVVSDDNRTPITKEESTRVYADQ